MIRSTFIALFALSVAACASETEEPAQEQAPAVEVHESVDPQVGEICLPQKLPICQSGFSCYCARGYRWCYCN